MKCTLCGSVLINKKDKYYYDCNVCKALVKDDIYYLSADEERTRYETHNNDVTDIRYQSFTSPITNYVLKEFSPNHIGLDFGSGTGPVISSMLSNRGYKIHQYDPFFAPDKSVLENKFDYIVSCEVFEHFHNPKLEIDNLLSKLNTGGNLLVMTMIYNDEIDFRNWNYRDDDTHVFIYRKETIEYIAKTRNLRIDELTDRFIAFKQVV